MNSKIASEFIEMALQKQSTEGYANLSKWDKEDAINKAALEYFRKQYFGNNIRKEQNEESTILVDDLQKFLVERSLSAINYDLYADSIEIPENYLYFNNLFVYCNKGECRNQLIVSTLVENSNTDDYLSDWNFSPSFDFEQCFHILIQNKLRIFHGGDFDVSKVKLFYYRKPQKIYFDRDLEKEWEFKEDVAHIIIDMAVKNLAANIEHISANQHGKENILNNT